MTENNITHEEEDEQIYDATFAILETLNQEQFKKFPNYILVNGLVNALVVRFERLEFANKDVKDYIRAIISEGIGDSEGNSAVIETMRGVGEDE